MSAYSIATRGLAGRKVPQGVLTPMAELLFSASEPGAWYDPSDMSTLFQDSAGTVPVTAVEQPVGRILDKSGRGNHATQATTTKRPVLSRQVNLFGATLPTGLRNGTGTLIPDAFGGVSGYQLTRTNTSDEVFVPITPTALLPGTSYTLDVYLAVGASSTSAATFTLYTSAGSTSANIIHTTGGFAAGASTNGFSCSLVSSESVAGGWRTRIKFTIPTSAPAMTIARMYMFAGAATGSPGMIVGNPQFTLATDAHLPYQRVDSATDYDADPDKFPAYRRADGVDDSLASSTGGGGTTGFFFSAAISPQGSADTARTLFSDAGTNTGYIVRLNASNQFELSAGNGTAYTTIATVGTLAVSATDVVQAWDDGTTLNVKIGSGPTASIARPVVVAGTAGYTLYQDNGASTGYFNGRSHGEIYRKDSGLTQSQREAVAVYQRQKARIA